MPKEIFIAKEDDLFASPGQGHVQFAVYAFIGEGDEAFQLRSDVGAQRDDDDIPGAALVAFHGVNGDAVSRQVVFFELFQNAGDLGPVGCDDARLRSG